MDSVSSFPMADTTGTPETDTPSVPPHSHYDLCGVAEIADRAKVSPHTVHRWIQSEPSFPPPVVELKMGRVYDWVEVYDWLWLTDRTPTQRRLRGKGAKARGAGVGETATEGDTEATAHPHRHRAESSEADPPISMFEDPDSGYNDGQKYRRPI